MSAGLLYVLGIFASLGLYANHIDALKRIRDKETVGLNIVMGTICIFILYLAITSLK